MAPRRNGRGLWGYAPACCGRLCESVPSSTLAVRCLYVTQDGSPTRRPALPMELPRHTSCTRPPAAAGAFSPCRWWLALPASGREPVQPSCADAEVGHDSFQERSEAATLACRESWRGHGCALRSEEHTSELQSLMRSSYAVFCLK